MLCGDNTGDTHTHQGIRPHIHPNTPPHKHNLAYVLADPVSHPPHRVLQPAGKNLNKSSDVFVVVISLNSLFNLLNNSFI